MWMSVEVQFSQMDGMYIRPYEQALLEEYIITDKNFKKP